MEDIDVTERLWRIVGRFGIAELDTTIVAGMWPPFDITRPNLHDSKADFLEEKRSVDAAYEHAKELLCFLSAQYRLDDAEHRIAKRVLSAVDFEVRRSVQREPTESAVDVVRKAAADVGLSHSLIFMLINLAGELSLRKQELENQEALFWSTPGRAPNYYARTIALRFAQLIARKTGKRPTFGTASDGGHPSTEFGRALEEVFELLGIKAHVRSPAKWAIDQITDSDLKVEAVNYLARANMGIHLGRPHGKNAVAAMFDAPKKDDER